MTFLFLVIIAGALVIGNAAMLLVLMTYHWKLAQKYMREEREVWREEK